MRYMLICTFVWRMLNCVFETVFSSLTWTRRQVTGRSTTATAWRGQQSTAPISSPQCRRSPELRQSICWRESLVHPVVCCLQSDTQAHGFVEQIPSAFSCWFASFLLLRCCRCCFISSPSSTSTWLWEWRWRQCRRLEPRLGSQPDTDKVILSDSQSMLCKIERFMLGKERIILLKKYQVKDTTCIYYMDHSDRRGNKGANELAGKAAVHSTVIIRDY